ncbi:uncharacterized protein LOC111409487 [Olea europaea var. sylvestris]|uniref:uncharacterized protein LOC111409487 n=1 Tax=Olea europaea var. sylvestris TaxID=158386 RepID=UPI000C1D2070|nr:uncharacterized protein LOC111409487 [Olea europaea var. sylvestris]
MGSSSIRVYLEICNKKGTKNIVADHLSMVEQVKEVVENGEINEIFPDEQLMHLRQATHTPWYKDHVEIFYVWDFEFIWHFPFSFSNQYKLVAIDYVLKWVEAAPLPTNNARVVVNFLKKNIFPRYSTPQAIISDGGKHFCNRLFDSLLTKYRVKHHVATTYHFQTNGQVEISNRELKRILELTVKIFEYPSMDLNKFEGELYKRY